jgi:hypothetical protein
MMVGQEHVGRRVRFRPFFITNPKLEMEGTLLEIRRSFMGQPGMDDAIVEVGPGVTYNCAVNRVNPLTNAHGVPTE